MMLVDRIHSFEPSNPRRVAHLEDRIGLQTAHCERMSFESFIVRRAKHVCVRMVKRNERDQFASSVLGHGSDAGTVPPRWRVLEIVRQMKMPFIDQDHRTRRPHRRLRYSTNLDNEISMIDRIHLSA